MSESGECLRCNVRLPALAAFCHRCGFVVERKPQVSVPNELRTLADRHRRLMRAFIAFFAAQILVALQLAQFVPAAAIVAGMFWFILVIVLMASVLSLATALHFGVLASLLLTIFSLVPIVNLLIALWLARRAAAELRLAGIRVGFFGAEKSALDVIAYEHRCRSCGYDLRGLTSLKCPECGAAFAAPLTPAPT